ncbi:protein kinase domain-containing protein [Corallococcus silvisoli]|uniref:protein kinase domain-containing protein n=1 Tax=Corallococcus silvisoli TaxID=2697031 RepID=UPI0013774F99|nr:protein kinase [Corallococcus silvisoli]NBD09045.1 protein kinase [Corallococcus silvisoli]
MTSRYRLLQPLATGGMAELFLGVAKGAEGFERTVAIKRVLPHLAREPDIASMFVSEARLSMLLQHQNIVTVHDVGESTEGLFLVMELVDGWDLGALLRAVTRQGLRVPPHLAVFIASQAQAGLQHAYRKQSAGQPLVTAHRDVSPSNVLVSREGEVKVTDFGIARLAGLSRTEPGAFKGKLPYAAPELLRGEPATALSDQFSLGIILAELLAGQHPFGSSAEPMAVAHSILNRAPASLPDVPASLATLVLRMLSRDPGGRFPEPEDVSEALARWLAQAGEPASSHALAMFLRGVKLPASVGERARAAQAEAPASTSASFVMSVPSGEGPGPQALEPATRASTRAYGTPESAPTAKHSAPWKPSPAAVPVSGEEEAPWSPSPGGASLSASGEVLHACTLCGAALESPESPCESCTQRPSAAGSGRAAPPGDRAPARPGEGGARMATTGRDGGSGRAPGAPPAGAQTGRVSGGGGPAAARAALPEDAPAMATQALSDVDESERMNRPSIREAGAGDLELEARAPRPEGTSWELEPPVSPRPRRRWGVAVALFGVAAVLAAGALFAWPRYERQVLQALGVPTALVSIRSEPSGATVFVDGVQVGVTPLVMDNIYPVRAVPVQLKLRGYRPWTGSFMGGKKADVDAELKR